MGKPITSTILSAPFYKDDELIGFQGIARDITEKKKMEIRLRESEEYYRTLVETSPDAIVIVDAGGRFTFASPKTHELFGIPAHDLHNWNLDHGFRRARRDPQGTGAPGRDPFRPFASASP